MDSRRATLRDRRISPAKADSSPQKQIEVPPEAGIIDIGRIDSDREAAIELANTWKAQQEWTSSAHQQDGLVQEEKQPRIAVDIDEKARAEYDRWNRDVASQEDSKLWEVEDKPNPAAGREALRVATAVLGRNEAFKARLQAMHDARDKEGPRNSRQEEHDRKARNSPMEKKKKAQWELALQKQIRNKGNKKHVKANVRARKAGKSRVTRAEEPVIEDIVVKEVEVPKKQKNHSYVMKDLIHTEGVAYTKCHWPGLPWEAVFKCDEKHYHRLLKKPRPEKKGKENKNDLNARRRIAYKYTRKDCQDTKCMKQHYHSPQGKKDIVTSPKVSGQVEKVEPSVVERSADETVVAKEELEEETKDEQYEPKNKGTERGSDVDLSKTTVLLPCPGTVKHGKFLVAVSHYAGSLMHLLGAARVVSETVTGYTVQRGNRFMLRGTKKTFGKLDKRRNGVNPLRAAGFATCIHAEIYTELHKLLKQMDWGKAKCRNGKGERVDTLINQWENYFDTKLTHYRKHPEFDLRCWAMTKAKLYTEFLEAELLVEMPVNGKVMAFATPGAPNETTADRGVLRTRDEPIFNDELFINNNSFRLEGEIFTESGDVKIGYHYTMRDSQKTTHWSGTSSSAEHLAENPGHGRNSMRRLTCKIKPEVKGYHEALMKNQKHFAEAKEKVGPYWEEVRYEFERTVERAEKMFEEQLKRAPSAKKLLYLRTAQNLKDCGFIGTENGKLIKNEAKQKAETAEDGGTKRQFVNLGVETTLSDGQYLYLLKIAMEKVVTTKLGQIKFVKRVSQPILDDWAKSILDPTGHGGCSRTDAERRSRGWVHSDDGCLIFVKPDGTFRYFDVDISKCDRTQKQAAFDEFGYFFEHLPHFWKRAMKAVMRPLTVMCKGIEYPKGKGRGKAVPLEPYLPSGHVFTTAINTMTLIVILYRLMEELNSNPSATADQLIDAAYEIGYKLKVFERESAYQCTFLKKHMAKSEYGAVSVPALGTVLRSAFKCRGDINVEKSLQEEAMKARTVQILDSLYYNVKIPMIEDLKNQFRERDSIKSRVLKWRPMSTAKARKQIERVKSKVISELEYKVDTEYRSRYKAYVTNSAYLKRYFGDNEAQKELLVRALSNLKYSHYHTCEQFDKILEMDYELEPRRPEYSGGYDRHGASFK